MMTPETSRNDTVKLPEVWKAHLKEEFQKPYMVQLKNFLKSEHKLQKKIYPKGSQIFNALNTTPLDNVKVVIIGQDPYHGPGQAHGLCFSVQKGVPTPPSLVNIYKELNSDLSTGIPTHGDLTHWAEQGVLMLNATLTVEDGKAGSHQNKGWETFTDKVIEVVNKDPRPKVFILWGSFAQKKAQFVDRKKHLVIESPHPSPLSAHRGFFGSKPFSKTNRFLISKGLKPIQW